MVRIPNKEIEYGEDPLFASHAEILKQNLSKGVFEKIADFFANFNRFSKYEQSINQALGDTEEGQIVKAAIKASNAINKQNGGHTIDLNQQGGAANFQSMSESMQKRKKR